MKPKDIKFPYSWKERKPLLQDQILFVPKYYDKHTQWRFPDFADPELFGNTNEVLIEYCSGNGSWIAEKAMQNPDKNWIAVEKKFERVAKIWAKSKNMNLKNFLIVCGDAIEFTKYYLTPQHIIHSAYVNFPDPWPKEKHAKHRLLQGEFLVELSRVIIKGGTVTVVTDDDVYRDQVCDEMLKTPDWYSAFCYPFFTKQWPGYGSSYFEELWRAKGKEIFYLQFSH
ncbi:MAG: tRNA (guanosine(46)-N7)-methyltransferase TrmB [Chlamydiae bacterium]|jgi:tRNA (guanine-N7-)-methyltransferase|nr:tRNA (guanosine(46)-N7)-methyltransferase TrmB [Chlamydiota bacterium]